MNLSPAPYSPASFAGYERTFDSVPLTNPQIRDLTGYLEGHFSKDEELLIALWYYVFQISLHLIERYTGIPNAYGYVERLRFQCRKYLRVSFELSDSDMGKALEPLLRETEIVLLRKRQGICWINSQDFRYNETLRTLGEEKQKRILRELEYQPIDQSKWISVPDETIGQHIRSLLDIPEAWDKLLYLRYVEGYSFAKIRRENFIQYPKGTLEYIRRLFAERMQTVGLPDDDSMTKIVRW